MAGTDTATPGTIEPGVMYTLPEFRRRVGWGLYATRTARRNGLRVIRTAGRVYVRGDDALAYFDRLADAEGPTDE
jgi:hypothetical protein